MTRIVFVVPAHGRLELTRVCLRALTWTCREMRRRYGLVASAVVIACDGNLETAEELEAATVRRDNSVLGRRFNDGYQLACDPRYNATPADYCVPLGSDDWIDPAIFARLPHAHAIGVFRHLAIVDETRTRLSRLRLSYAGGAGIRIIPRALIEAAGYRPCEEDRKRGCDMSTLWGITRANGRRRPPLVNLDVHELQIVDWKTRGEQLNTYHALRGFRRGDELDVRQALEAVYPAHLLSELLEAQEVAA